MLVKVAVPDTREHPHERVRSGVVAAGDDVGVNTEECEGIITWNDYGVRGKLARQIKSAGGVHVAMENGHLRRDLKTCLATRDGFNGTGWSPFRDMNSKRLERFGVKLQPWRRGAHVLVCGQMGGAYSPMAMDDAWPTEIVNELLSKTDRPIVYLPHRHRQRWPKIENRNLTILDPSTPIESALKNAHACVVWTSSKITDALIAGVPGFYCGKKVAVAAACFKGVDRIETPLLGQRQQIFNDLAWQNWLPDEVSRGVPWGILRDA